jgi:hypothetical protein
MDKQARRQAQREFKEREVWPGVYAVRCLATGEVWVAASRNIDSQENSVWFSLRTGGHPNRALQAAWAKYGAEGLAYEVLERIVEPELTPLGLADRSKAQEAHWRATLGAAKAVG